MDKRKNNQFIISNYNKMKNLILTTLLALLFLPAFGQSKSVEALYQKHKSSQDFFHMDLGGNFLSFAEGFNVKMDKSKTESLVKTLDRVKLFKVPHNLNFGNADYKSLTKSLERENYDLLIETSDKSNNILVYTKGNKSISDVVVLLNDKGGDLMVVELLGKFDAKTLADAGKTIGK
jgi:hypothetical protein